MPSLLYIFGLYTSRAMGRTTLARKNLLAWQWSDYPSRHQDAGNLMLHIVVVPLFQVATLVLAYGVVTGRVGAVGLAALGTEGGALYEKKAAVQAAADQAAVSAANSFNSSNTASRTSGR